MVPMLASFRQRESKVSGYRQKAVDQPFNLLKIAGVTVM